MWGTAPCPPWRGVSAAVAATSGKAQRRDTLTVRHGSGPYFTPHSVDFSTTSMVGGQEDLTSTQRLRVPSGTFHSL